MKFADEVIEEFYKNHDYDMSAIMVMKQAINTVLERRIDGIRKRAPVLSSLSTSYTDGKIDGIESAIRDIEGEE